MDCISDPENKVALEFLSPSFTAAFKEYRRQRLPCILTAFILIKMNLHLDSKLRFQILRRILLRSVTMNKISLQSQTEESEVVRTADSVIFRLQPECLRFSDVMKKTFTGKYI